ncbi:MAG: hypothetical protein P1V97_22375 [Planctomycetota bacterium]|nr:hypothetical protein [Planctomycetota bacterium]
MSGKALPIQQLNKDLVFKPSERRLSFQVARIFYVLLALFVVGTGVLIAVPKYQVPRSKPYQAARAFLQKNRVLKLHLGQPLKVAKSPDSFRRDGSMWRFLIAVDGLDRSDTVLVTVDERSEKIRVLEARFQHWNLVNGATLLKDRKKPQ